jgi:hypothetical protein
LANRAAVSRISDDPERLSLLLDSASPILIDVGQLRLDSAELEVTGSI